MALKFLEKDVDSDRLKSQLLMLPDMIKTALTEVPVKQVTNARTIACGMEQNDIYKGIYFQ